MAIGFKGALVLLCGLSFVSPGHSQMSLKPSGNNSGPSLQETDQEQVLSYWTIEGGWSSEVQLRNNIAGENLVVTPVLRAANGEQTWLPPVTVKPDEVKGIDIRSAIEIYAPGFAGTYGSLALRYHSLSFHNLYAAMMVHDTGHPIAFHIDALGHIEEFEGATREGIWWLPNDTVKDILVLTNQGTNPLDLDLLLYDAQGKEAAKHVDLGPRQTGRYSIRELVRDAGLSGTYGGFQVRAASHAGSLDTLHAIYDEAAGFSALLKMFDHDPKATIQQRDFARTSTWTLRAPMLALSSPDPALNFPGGTVLQPQLFLRNTTSRKRTAILRFNWRRGEAAGKALGPTVALAPHETRRIDVAALQNGTLLPKDAQWAAVVLATDGQPDEIMALAASYDSTLRYGAQTPFSDQLSHVWEGGQWEYDSMHDSIITAANGGSKATKAAFTIFYGDNQQKYELEQTLQPDEQMWIDIGKLIRNHVPDETGKLLPPNLETGSYQFSEPTGSALGSLFEGKVIYDQTFGHVSYGCAACCAASLYTQFQYNPFGVGVGSQGSNEVQGYNDCTDAWTDINQDFPNWKTANPAIATTTNLGLHTGMSVGATTSSTYGYVVKTNGRNGCYEVQEPLSGPTNVASLGCPASTTRGSSVTCTLSGSSGETISSWKFTDANGNTVTRTSNPTSTTWSGVMVASGTVAATAGGSPVSANIAVNNRTNFAFTAVNPSSEPNGFSGDGCSITIPSPPAQSGAAAGKFCLNQQATVNTQTVSDNGPNNGYSYVTSITNVNGNLTTGYFYVISPDLQNGSSAFYLAQCGTYNAQSNPNGFISGANLLTNTIRHESGTVQSHYENYVTAQNNSANNIGTTAEGMVGLEVAQTLANNVVTAINQDRQTILSAAQVEPCSVQENAACVFQGFVNFLPYQSCN